MRERPIIFSAPMVRAILDGRKTQTRRAMRDQPCKLLEFNRGAMSTVYQSFTPQFPPVRCPYGAPGDHLWVRDSFIHEPADYCWEASVSIPCRPATTIYRADSDPLGLAKGVGWRPSIHMPRSLSRIALEITGVRVERLQDISEADAEAEGCEANPYPGPWWQGYRDVGNGRLIHQQSIGETPPEWMIEPKRMYDHKHLDMSAVDAYRALWFQINGLDSWKANPWVWVVSFRRITP